MFSIGRLAGAAFVAIVITASVHLALASNQFTLPFRNPLAYPAGVPAGFDPSHPAAKNCQISGGFSGVAQGGNIVNLLNGKVGTISGSPTNVLNSVIGPSTKFTGNSDNVTFAEVAPAAGALPITMAAVFVPTAFTQSFQHIMITDATSGNMIGTNTTPTFLIQNAAVSGAPVPIANVPYFFATSFDTVNGSWVIRRLDTGQIYAGVLGVDPSLTFSTTLYIGNRNVASRQLQGEISELMLCPSKLSQGVLLWWAQRPHSFWHPGFEPSDFGVGGIASTLGGGLLLRGVGN